MRFSLSIVTLLNLLATEAVAAPQATPSNGTSTVPASLAMERYEHPPRKMSRTSPTVQLTGEHP